VADYLYEEYKSQMHARLRDYDVDEVKHDFTALAGDDLDALSCHVDYEMCEKYGENFSVEITAAQVKWHWAAVPATQGANHIDGDNEGAAAGDDVHEDNDSDSNSSGVGDVHNNAAVVP
jgi:hypothetical protein